jgi:diguanylate cyclase (GGDEF)-like protein
MQPIMPIFDIHTIMLSYLVSNILVTIVMVNVWFQNRKRFKGTSHWLIYYLLQTAGILLIILKDCIPYFFSTVFANSIIVCSLMFFLIGLQRFIEKKATYAINIVYLIIFSILYYYFRIIDPVFRVRVLLFSISVIIIISQSIYLLLFRTEKNKRVIYRNTAIVCIFLLFLYCFRVAAAFFIYSPDNDFYSVGIVDSIIMMASQMLGIMMTFSLVLMINMRLFLDVQQFAEEKELMVQELRRLANTDSLTGIYNRAKIEQILTIEVLRSRRYKHPLSIIIADIDHFKLINDTYGHNVGDVVLTGIASMMKEHVREVDTVGRWGGEEFLIVCPETTAEGAKKLAEKLRKKIERHHFKDIGIKTVSMGIAQIEADDWDEDMLKRADKNLYKAKRSGRNRVF